MICYTLEKSTESVLSGRDGLPFLSKTELFSCHKLLDFFKHLCNKQKSLIFGLSKRLICQDLEEEENIAKEAVKV